MVYLVSSEDLFLKLRTGLHVLWSSLLTAASLETWVMFLIITFLVIDSCKIKCRRDGKLDRALTTYFALGIVWWYVSDNSGSGNVHFPVEQYLLLSCRGLDYFFYEMIALIYLYSHSLVNLTVISVYMSASALNCLIWLNFSCKSPGKESSGFGRKVLYSVVFHDLLLTVFCHDFVLLL